MLSSSCGLEKKLVRRKIEVYKSVQKVYKTCFVFLKKQEQRPFRKIKKKRNKEDNLFSYPPTKGVFEM